MQMRKARQHAGGPFLFWRLVRLPPLADSPVSSISVATHESLEHRDRDDLDVEPERPVVDIEEVELHAALHLLDLGRRAAISVHLRPAGDAWLDPVAEHV